MPRPAAIATWALVLALIAACGSKDRQPYTVMLAEGTYHAINGIGLPAGEEARLLSVTARLDRQNGQIVFTLADGSQRALLFSPRPRDEWGVGCPTMSSWAVDEVADLAPAPLQLESLTFATPVVYAICDPTLMILANGPGGESPFLKLQLQ